MSERQNGSGGIRNDAPFVEDLQKLFQRHGKRVSPAYLRAVLRVNDGSDRPLKKRCRDSAFMLELTALFEQHGKSLSVEVEERVRKAIDCLELKANTLAGGSSVFIYVDREADGENVAVGAVREALRRELHDEKDDDTFYPLFVRHDGGDADNDPLRDGDLLPAERAAVVYYMSIRPRDDSALLGYDVQEDRGNRFAALDATTIFYFWKTRDPTGFLYVSEVHFHDGAIDNAIRRAFGALSRLEMLTIIDLQDCNLTRKLQP